MVSSPRLNSWRSWHREKTTHRSLTPRPHHDPIRTLSFLIPHCSFILKSQNLRCELRLHSKSNGPHLCPHRLCGATCPQGPPQCVSERGRAALEETTPQAAPGRNDVSHQEGQGPGGSAQAPRPEQDASSARPLTAPGDRGHLTLPAPPDGEQEADPRALGSFPPRTRQIPGRESPSGFHPQSPESPGATLCRLSARCPPKMIKPRSKMTCPLVRI